MNTKRQNMVAAVLVVGAMVALAARVFVPFAGDLSLMEAAHNGDVAAVRHLLRAGVSPNADDDGTPALLGAISNKHEDVVRVLLDAGADVNMRAQSNGYTPLLDAATTNVSIVRLLLSRGANVNAQDRDGMTPLMIAATNADLDIVRVLLAAGANVRLKDNWGETALHKAATSYRHDGPFRPADVVAALKKAGAKA